MTEFIEKPIADLVASLNGKDVMCGWHFIQKWTELARPHKTVHDNKRKFALYQPQVGKVARAERNHQREIDL